MNLRVTTVGGSRTLGAFIFHPNPPVVTSIHMKQLTAVANREVVVEGQNLQYEPKVIFGDHEAMLESVSDERLIFVPASGVQRGFVSVYTSHGSTVSRSPFELTTQPPPM